MECILKILMVKTQMGKVMLRDEVHVFLQVECLD